ncbi:hypothetical protein HZF24_09460 [Sedimentibacter hydroxybenzoicus DSM 7310]|uniref:Uncharacterized protein n=1 Tax=Sedimentibacter hydroxybenzoicus DSM 7310 TaxID=1123245 RepID=A0A974BJJ5_SEDHY|nr:hypothetical protein [Sedimentibacter hydroxybenzoicus]NYB74359.1 hypothetical protein [Sedimentibacter hydroxybenzoicus DSM 7310]
MVTNYSILHDIPKLKIQKKKLLHAEKELDRILKGEKRPYRSNRFIRRITPKIHEEYEKKRTTSRGTWQHTMLSNNLKALYTKVLSEVSAEKE